MHHSRCGLKLFISPFSYGYGENTSAFKLKIVDINVGCQWFPDTRIVGYLSTISQSPTKMDVVLEVIEQCK